MDFLTIEELARRIEPSRTVLFFGAGSSIPSGAPSSEELVQILESKFELAGAGLNLMELASLIEGRGRRKTLIETIRARIVTDQPTRGVLALPAYDWKAIYSTNYDELVEVAFSKAGKALRVIVSDFDLGANAERSQIPLYKIHGSIDQDIVLGHRARLVISEVDYDQTSVYREKLYRIFEADLAQSDLVIVGHSLTDPHIKQIIDRVAKMHNTTASSFNIYLLLYSRDETRAELLQKRNFNVVFGGIDDFMAALGQQNKRKDGELFALDSSGGLGARLGPSTIDVSHELIHGRSGFEKMFNGRPATYSDISADFTFGRDAERRIAEDLTNSNQLVAAVIGASGVGKSTLCRQVMQKLSRQGIFAWEHIVDHELDVDAWFRYAKGLPDGQFAILFVDEANLHLNDLNELVDRCVDLPTPKLKVLLACTKNMWSPRVKSPHMYKRGREYALSRLSDSEIEALLNLVEAREEVRRLVEPAFGGFSRNERRRRLAQRCDADMFVCLRNIFASTKFDEIILREYAGLTSELQDVYRIVSALESFGVRVHRQLAIRLTSISDMSVAAVLASLDDIVSEYDVEPRKGVYGWRGRHVEISGIIRRHKYNDPNAIVRLLTLFIENVVPSIPMEMWSIREICQGPGGIRSIASQEMQNRLYRKIITELPSEKVPRHRLIQNLIRAGEYDAASAEIRIYEKDFRGDGAILRYRIVLDVHRAQHTPGLMTSDRLAISRSAFEASKDAANRYPNNKYIFFVLADAAKACFRFGGAYDPVEYAVEQLKGAEDRIGDPEIARVRRRLEGIITTPDSAWSEDETQD